MKIQKWLDINTEDLKNKRIAITGSTGGLGKEICSYFASLGASLVLLDRNAERSELHKKSLEERFSSVDVECIQVDLEDIYSVKKCTDRLVADGIDVFIHNAGAYSIPRRRCESGYDNVFQINFASPYYMICRLLPALHEREGRVIAVGSIAHNYSKIDKNDVDFKKRNAASKVYGNAKRYLMFSLFELFKNEEKAHLSVVHPGITFTNITAHYPKLIFAIIKHPMKIIFMKPRKAALSIIKGVFEDTGYCEWIGPSIFDVWGYPRKRRLNTCKEAEIKDIADISESVYKHLEEIL